MLQSKCKPKDINMNAMQLNQYAFSLGMPNVQIVSEEILGKFDEKNKKVYGMPFKDTTKNFALNPEIVEKPDEKIILAVQEAVKVEKEQKQSILGKRQQPSEQTIDFDMDEIEDEVQK